MRWMLDPLQGLVTPEAMRWFASRLAGIGGVMGVDGYCFAGLGELWLRWLEIASGGFCPLQKSSVVEPS